MPEVFHGCDSFTAFVVSYPESVKISLSNKAGNGRRRIQIRHSSADKSKQCRVPSLRDVVSPCTVGPLPLQNSGPSGIKIHEGSIGQRAALWAQSVRCCENGQLKEHSANGYFDLGADAPDGGPMNAKETSDFSCRTAFI